jgi:hypothetical protein
MRNPQVELSDKWLHIRTVSIPRIQEAFAQ